MTSRTITLLLVLLAATTLAACKDAPGADGRYATLDHGQLNRGSP